MIFKSKLRIFLALLALALVAAVGIILLQKNRGSSRLEKARSLKLQARAASSSDSR